MLPTQICSQSSRSRGLQRSVRMNKYILAALMQKRQAITFPEFVHLLEWMAAFELNSTSNEFRQKFPFLDNWQKSFSAIEIKAEQINFEKDQQQGVEWVTPVDQAYPASFLNLSDPPFCLRIKGSPIWCQQLGLAVVGSREPSEASLAWLEQNLPPVIETFGLYTVSGGARGIDQRVHSASLRLNRPTIVLLPSGIRSIYPSSLSFWEEMIISRGGVLISEYSSETVMQKSFFPQRNRLIPALGVATLIVEARRRSGTLITAKQSAEQGRPLFVIPSHPFDAGAQGGLDLICDGATPVRDAQDLILLLRSEISMCPTASGCSLDFGLNLDQKSSHF